ncbi:hypothetical protein DYQ86_04850 [Acidobacteria bacterium AB60]|nr:hypothetical protein DYQ86_04850 [Acidobacteria bacterium AB60]
MITGPERKTAICFEEWPDVLARPKNEKELANAGFNMFLGNGGDSHQVEIIVEREAIEAGRDSRSMAFDISSMTRAWHGGIIRQLRSMELDRDFETFFAYVPAKFTPPSARVPPNEIVAPVDGFASLAVPDLPIAAVIGLGYEPERALGLQQYLDPQLTLLMTPKTGDSDPFYAALRHNNRGLLNRTDSKWIFEYDLTEVAGTFSTLASVVGGLRESYRVVLVSLGPKIFGVLSFLLAAKFRDVSVWRVSAGMHGRPRDAFADMNRVVVASALWEPSNS